MAKRLLMPLLFLAACSPPPSGMDAGILPIGGGGGGGGGGGAGCPAVPADGGTTHSDTLSSPNEVWSPAGNPHVITFPLRVRTGEKLTLEPCVVVRIEHDDGLEVRAGGELIAEGTASQPITIERQEAAPWGQLYIGGHATARLAYVTIQGGAALSNSQPANVAMFRISIDPNEDIFSQSTRVDHVTVRDSAGVGVFLEGNAGFTDDSHDLIITGSGSAPLRVWERAVGTIPSGTYTGNAKDEFVLERGGYGADRINGSVTIRDRGLPYHVTSDLRVGYDGNTDFTGTLTIEPGVTLRFDRNTNLQMAGTSSASGDADLALGSLHAVGTADKPIIFTSSAATPAAGDWGGLVFQGVATSATRIEHAVISYAGGGTGFASASCGVGGSAGDEAAVTITGWDAQPTSQFIVNTRIENSPRYGIVEGWRGDAVDFVSTNTFVGVASCWVSLPRSRTNGCPAMPTCPGVP